MMVLLIPVTLMPRFKKVPPCVVLSITVSAQPRPARRRQGWVSSLELSFSLF
jgi:hypothetical protein